MQLGRQQDQGGENSQDKTHEKRATQIPWSIPVEYQLVHEDNEII